MDFNEIFLALQGRGGVILLLLLAVVVFFRGGVVSGKAYEATVAAYEKRLEQEDKEIQFWRDAALRAIQVGEKVLNGSG